MGVASLVLGIIGLVGGSFTGGIGGMICGILAIILGAIGRKDQNRKGMATAGLVLGIISLVSGVLVMFICGAAVAVGAAAVAEAADETAKALDSIQF